jgi:hypothetical protein
MKECFVRLTGKFSEAQLAELGLWPMLAHQQDSAQQNLFQHKTVA